MTETEWLACLAPQQLVRMLAGKILEESRHGVVRTPVPEFIRRQTSDRKFRLLAVAWYRRVWHLLDGVGRRVVEVAERQADSRAGQAEAVAVQQELRETDAPLGLWAISHDGLFGAELARGQIVDFLAQFHPSAGPASALPALVAEETGQAALCRDIFGNPFRPVTLDPAWLTSTVVSLAEGIYAERAFDRLPILADALQDAGCEVAEVLDHCRGPGPHARGCWVVDLVLGKT
jgi:hypothetical protein